MTRAALLLTFVLSAMTTIACTAGPKRDVRSDPVGLGLIPEGSIIVGETAGGVDPLLFVAPEDGTIYFFADDALLATIGVQKGQRIELNAQEAAGDPETVLSINGKPEFKSAGRAAHNRMFFAPAGKPVLTSTESL